MKNTEATMADVAKQAGVSAATVARVIYKNGYVKSETRQAVEAALVVTGYRPSLVARSLRTSRSLTFGLVVNETSLNAFPTAVSQIVQAEAMKYGYTVLMFNHQNDANLEAKGVEQFIDHRVDAVIFCTAWDPANVHFVKQRGIPTVQIERFTATSGNFVGVDPKEAMRSAVDHLHSLGHRHFAYLGGNASPRFVEGNKEDSVEATRERLFIECTERLGVEGVIRRATYHVDGKPKHQPGYYSVEELLKLTPRPTALICGSDLLAAAALQCFRDVGLGVPRDVSVIGFDDTLAEMLTPPLSSIAQPIEELGRIAIEMAMAAIDKPSMTNQSQRVPAHLVLRTSTGPVTASGDGVASVYKFADGSA